MGQSRLAGSYLGRIGLTIQVKLDLKDDSVLVMLSDAGN